MKALHLFLILLLSPDVAPAADPDALAKAFHAANQAFEAGSYKEAASQYEALLQAGAANGAIHYNLGDAYFRDKALGRAIFHFRKAAELLPRDPDVRFNLGHARSRATDRIEARGLAHAIDTALPLSEREALQALALAAALFFGACIARVLAKRAWIGWLQLGLGAVFVAAMLVAGQKIFSRPALGVVTAAEAGVHSGTGKDTTLLFSLHEGAELSVSESSGDWIKIQLADGKRGWMRKTDVVFQSPD